MKQNLYFLTIRALFVIVGVTVVIAKGKAYLEALLGVHIDERLYFLVGLIVYGGALSLSMRGLLVELKRKANKRQSVVGSNQGLMSSAKAGVDAVHRCPLWLVALEAGYGLFIMLGVLFSNKPIPFAGYAISFAAVAGVLVIVI